MAQLPDPHQELLTMATKITRLLLTTLVLSLGFGQLLRFEIYGLPFFIHDLLVLLIIAFNLKSLVSITINTGLKVFGVGLLLGWTHALFSYPAAELLVPALYTLRLLSYLCLYLIIKSKKTVINSNVFKISGLVMLTLGLTQYFFMPDMRWAQYLGWDDHLSRLTLPHYDPTFTGVMLALAILTHVPIISGSLLYNLVLLTFYSVSLLLTYSRSVWLSLMMTGFYFIKNRLVLLAAALIMFIAITALPERFGEGTNLLRTYSITSRFESDLGYIKKYGWSLLVGRGLNTLILDQEATSLPNHASGPNNSYLYILATTGLVGLIGWGMFMRSLYLLSSHRPMLIFFFVASLFNNVMLYPFALLWVLLQESS